MNWQLFISWRYLTTRRKERFISLISLISVLGIALGVMALIVVISVMNGFDKELREKIVGVNPHIYIEKEGGIDEDSQLFAVLDKAKYVRGAAPFINGQALFKANEQVSGVLVRGIDPVFERDISKIDRYLVSGSLDLGRRDIIVGKELAKRYYLNLGDKAVIISPIGGKNFNFKVAGIFDSGMYEYDLNLVFTDIKAAQKIFDMRGRISGIGVRLDNLYRATKVRASLQQDLGYPYWVRDWISMNRNLFSALKLEKTAMFVIMALIVVVACFNIAGTLIMMVMEKTKDIGILKAIGANSRQIKRIFILKGLIIGVFGTVLGTALGGFLCHLLKTYKFISLPRDVYYIETLPVEMRWSDSIIIIAAALIISLLATVYPARQAAGLNPAESLRYE